MTFDQISKLGRIRVFGGVTENRYTWLLNGRASRVPAGSGVKDLPAETPGVFSLRTMLLGIERRDMQATGSGTRTFPFQDAALLDLQAATEEREGESFVLQIMGVSMRVKLQAVARCTLSPLWEHPGGREKHAADQLLVSAYSLRAGSMRIAASHAPAVAAELLGLEASKNIDLVPDGIEYTAKVEAPDGRSIDSRVMVRGPTQ